MWFTAISCAVMAAALFGCRLAGHPALDTLAESAQRSADRHQMLVLQKNQDVLPSTLSWPGYDATTRLLNEPALARGPSHEEFSGVRSVREIGRFANRAITRDELDVPVLGLAISALGVATCAEKRFQIPGGCGPCSGLPDLTSG